MTRAADAAAILRALRLQPLPVEGILFRQTWKREAGGKILGTAIIAAITDNPDSFSAMHRLTDDEIWHFYAGDPIELLLLHDDGAVSQPVLGADILAGQQPQLVVPAGCWTGGRLAPGGTLAVFGTTMAPGFQSSSYEAGDRGELCRRWPQAADQIVRLTRPGAPTHLPDGY